MQTYISGFLRSFLPVKMNIDLKLSDLHLIPRINNEADFWLAARMITSLAFAPLECLDNTIAELAMYPRS